ncbi:translation initiation factor IF-2-like [Lutra lutra]|uniref:translation initiation factor IF-2-like n=1 Tax=Lutra lutra TaxID=9657 RepID=UPI001FD23120|nr:translation initiation factor IF-2-like [Lutra lutra]
MRPAGAGRGPSGSAFVFLPQLRLRKCRPGPGGPLQPPQRPTRMTSDPEAGGEGRGRAGKPGAEPPTPARPEPRLRDPPSRCACGRGAPALRAGRPRGKLGPGCRAPLPGRAPPPRAGPGLTCCGRRRRSEARDAGGLLPPARGRGSGRRGGGCRGGARHRWRAGAARRLRRAGRGREARAEGRLAAASRAQRRRGLRPPSSRPGARSSRPAGPASGPRTRSQVQRSASCGAGGCVGAAPPGLPPALRPGGPPARSCGRSARRRGGAARSPHPAPARTDGDGRRQGSSIAAARRALVRRKHALTHARALGAARPTLAPADPEREGAGARGAQRVPGLTGQGRSGATSASPGGKGPLSVRRVAEEILLPSQEKGRHLGMEGA